MDRGRKAPFGRWREADMDEVEARAIRKRGGVALALAAIAFAFLGLAGPIALATGRDLSAVLPWYPVGWALAAAGWLYWLRCVRRAGRDS
jgi:hypothetical protein